METTLVIARVVVAAVLVGAGASKLLDRAGLRAACVALGIPPTFARTIAAVLPPLELVLAGLLLAGATAWWGAVGSLGLLVAFTALLVWNVVQGRRPDCHCFGQFRPAPIGGLTIVRNLLLVGMAGFVVLQGPSSAGPGALASASGRLDGDLLPAVVAVLIAVVAAQAVALAGLGRRLRQLETGGSMSSTAAGPASPVSGLPLGVAGPGFALPTPDGDQRTLEELREAGRPVLLLFTDPDCRPCRALVPEIGDWQRTYASALTIAVLTRGSAEDNADKATERGITNLLLQQGDEVARAYRYNGTPGAVVVEADGTVGSEMASGAPAIRALVAAVARRPAPVPRWVEAPPPDLPLRRLAEGDDAPALELASPDGTPVDLSAMLGRITLVVFWDPGCGFCQSLRTEWDEWEHTLDDEGPQVLVVSEGSAGDTAALGLHSTIVVDEGWTTARAFGVDGTPMAVLIDAEGRIASEAAVGGDEVMALAHRAAALARVAAALGRRRAPAPAGSPP